MNPECKEKGGYKKPTSEQPAYGGEESRNTRALGEQQKVLNGVAGQNQGLKTSAKSKHKTSNLDYSSSTPRSSDESRRVAA